MNLTATQQQAVAARGNVLVAAGAGTGKTRTLVERCLACLLQEESPASIDEILMVTFTEAAAAEMRQRIRERLEQERKSHPGESRWEEMLALFETAQIGTLHSFCYQLVRQHFYQLALDPQVSVLAEEQARVLADETLDGLLEPHYAGRDEPALAVQRLIQVQGRGGDKPIRNWVLRLHQHAQTLPDPAGWLTAQLALLSQPEPSAWRTWLQQAMAEFAVSWLPKLEAVAGSNQVAASCAAALRNLSSATSAAEQLAAFAEIAQACQNCLPRKKGAWVKPFEPFFAEADLLSSLICRANGEDPLKEDWSWVREQMTTLLELTREFSTSFAEAKRDLGVVDFHDLEQHALCLLWDPLTGHPTAFARGWRDRLRFIFVDEYQDINAAQDRIIQALSRDGAQANRFLVGDIKQSIYRFRLANPAIFQQYAREWSHGPGHVISLVENFRAREGLLEFVNSLFDLLMSDELGGVEYSAGSALRFGAPSERGQLSRRSNPEPKVELHLLLKNASAKPDEGEEPAEVLGEVAELLEAEKEARLVGLRLREVRTRREMIWDDRQEKFRPVDWGDMAILLRAPARKAESYAKEFARLKLPLQIARTGFYRSLEVLDLLSLLRLLDNPLQDLPALAVLHSPLVGLTASELAEIRLAALKVPFWSALQHWYRSGDKGRDVVPRRSPSPQNANPASAEPQSAPDDTVRKVACFLERFARWRRLARTTSLSRCLEMILSETQYDAWLLAQPNGAQRHANVQRLLTLAQQFDQFQGQSLFRFLKFVEAQQAAETEPEVPAVSAENAVRLMSIHQSKGLEFPVVVVADLGKPFNLLDLRAEVILDEQYGLCPRVKPPHTGKRYPSLAHWLGSRRQLRELLGEELRLLYVAMTRARDVLLLTGSVSRSKLDDCWRADGGFPPEARLAARSYTDWLALWFAQTLPAATRAALSGQTELIRWFIHEPVELILAETQTAPPPSDSSTPELNPEVWRQLAQRLAWRYPHADAIANPAKTSVSALRRRIAEEDAESVALIMPAAAIRLSRITESVLKPASSNGKRSKLNAAEIGNAHHQFLQYVSLERARDIGELRSEAERLEREGRLTPEQATAVDLNNLARFWTSDLGRRIRDRTGNVRRELAFTARFAPEELGGALLDSNSAGLEGELVLVQGVADLVVIEPNELWLVDFKTDQFSEPELDDHVALYRPQLQLYAKALSRIYVRPVTEAWLHFLRVDASVSVKIEARP